MSRQAVIGIVAHVDAGKSTLAEAMLYHCGVIRAQGRVDHGDSHFDTDAMEKARGITINNKQAVLNVGDARLMLIDTPGHTDFVAETERALRVLDYAVMVVGANDGVTGHTQTLWRLLQRYQVPTFVFINKIDLAGTNADAVVEQLENRLGGCFLQMSTDGRLCPANMEAAAMTDEAALEEFLGSGILADGTLRRLVVERKMTPCFAGSALKGIGVGQFLEGMAFFIQERHWPQDFGARVYGVSRGAKGERITWVKVTGGQLSPRQIVEIVGTDGSTQQKIDQLRLYQASKYDVTDRVEAGQVCGVIGLEGVRPGQGLGYESACNSPAIEPVVAYCVLPDGCDAHHLHRALLELSDEEPLLGVTWNERNQMSQVRLMGQIQLEVLADRLDRRFGFHVKFGAGSIVYKETIAKPVVGVGHFEPLRHYAEAHLRIEPLPLGGGVEFGCVCSEDHLDKNWQRLILINAMERPHLGVLTGAALTDVRITLLAGKAHAKHTVGGDFRQATYRAIRQGLMQAESILLEPWHGYELSIPADKVGRALSDLQAMSASFGPVDTRGDFAVIRGQAPVSEMQGYSLKVAAYTSGTGQLFVESAGYKPCHNTQQVVADAAYNPEADLDNSPDSVFCSHGAGYTVKWQDVPAHAHVDASLQACTPWRPADASFFGRER